MTLSDLQPWFQGHAITWHWISQKRYEIGTYILRWNTNNAILKGVTEYWLQSDLAKYVTEVLRGLSATAELLVKILCSQVTNRWMDGWEPAYHGGDIKIEDTRFMDDLQWMPVMKSISYK